MIQMPPHTKLFDSLKNNNSDERITNTEKSLPHLYQAAYSSSSSISNTDSITNSTALPLLTPLPILGSSAFDFTHLLTESDLVDSSSQESSVKDLSAQSVSDKDYLESCIEQMESSELNMPPYDILENLFDNIEVTNQV